MVLSCLPYESQWILFSVCACVCRAADCGNAEALIMLAVACIYSEGGVSYTTYRENGDLHYYYYYY